MSHSIDEIIAEARREAERVGHELASARERLVSVVECPTNGLDEDEKRTLLSYLMGIESSRLAPYESLRFDRLPIDALTTFIEELWGDIQATPVAVSEQISPNDSLQPLLDSTELEFEFAYIEPVRPEAKPNEWGFHMTANFIKSVKDLDKSMRGRVLDAITEICKHPLTAKGDTVKPLHGDLVGCWRYRLGDYRLIYQPFKEFHRIDLITIGGRGSVYVD